MYFFSLVVFNQNLVELNVMSWWWWWLFGRLVGQIRSHYILRDGWMIWIDDDDWIFFLLLWMSRYIVFWPFPFFFFLMVFLCVNIVWPNGRQLPNNNDSTHTHTLTHLMCSTHNGGYTTIGHLDMVVPGAIGYRITNNDDDDSPVFHVTSIIW